ncbi:uncharacterized protein LOC112553425 isoform X2 [Pomacea canaliculata]|uniref:uncharacterized protein LOC112553425 isoform X2 n=1 Tax=Pomacea canaliculata TaxID=400727 RepID=UPI000D737147|nr:uncharacterized protein LOC112553425 isoform X2 [Pomacea canaliculata]
MEWGVTGPFNALPTELLVIIFRELSNEDRGSCCQVCKRWREEIISEPSMWQKFEVTVRPGWNWEKTRSFFGGKGPRLYLHVRHLVLNLDRRAQGPQTVYARQANAVLSSVSKLLRALPHDMTLTSFSCSGFKYYSASKDWKSRVICELCKFLRRQKRFLEEVSFTSLELLSKQSWGSLLRAVAPTDEEGGESKIRRLSLTKMLHRTATPDMYFVKTIGRFSLLEQIEITFEHLKSEIIMTLVIACPLLRRLTLLFDLSLQPYFKDQNIYLIRNVVVAKNPELRVVLWLMVGDSVCGFLVNTSMFFIQLPVEGLVVDVSSLHTVTSVVDCYLDMMGKLYGNYLTFLEWSCVVRESWCYGPALVNLVNTCPRLASISLKNIILDLETATAISACSSSAERGKIKLRVGGICVSGEASSNALEEGIRQLKDSLDLQVVM